MKLTFIVTIFLFFNPSLEGKETLCDIDVMLNRLQYVTANAEELLNETSLENDNCVLTFSDTLASCFILLGEDKYIMALDAFCVSGDGYVSEYFFEIVYRIQLGNFSAFTDYLSKRNSCLETYLIQISNTLERKKYILEQIELEKEKSGCSEIKKEYLIKLSNKLI